MSAQLSRCVAVYSRHFVASRINAPRRRRRRRVYFGPFRNNPENNGVDQIDTIPFLQLFLTSTLTLVKRLPSGVLRYLRND